MTLLNFKIPSSSPLISYTGQWQPGRTNDTSTANSSQGVLSFMTADPDATATLDFIGIDITIYGKVPDNGNCSVELDNGSPFIGHGQNNTSQLLPLFNAQNLNSSVHTVVIDNIHTPKGEDFKLDFFSVGREIGPPGHNGSFFNVTLDDESPFIVYNGSWSSLFSATASNNTLHSTTKDGSSASLFFQGSSVELYGAGSSFQVQLDSQPSFNIIGSQIHNNNGHPGHFPGKGGPPGPNENLNFQPPLTLLFYADGLDENNTHVVTLTNSKSNNFQFMAPFFLDSAVVRSSQRFFNDTPSPNPEFTVPEPANAHSRAHSRASVGAIVGGVIGGLVGLIVLGFISFILIRRSRRSRHNYGLSTGERGAGSGPPFMETPVGQPIMSFVGADMQPEHGYNSSAASHFENTSSGTSTAQYYAEPFLVPTAI